jgi:hypothetical protein
MKPAPAIFAIIATVLLAAAAQSLAAQPLSGTFTCANGNPGNAFDYGDIGDFFNDLETFSVRGAVVLDVYDDGGPFTSNWNYQLGANYNPPPGPRLRVSGPGGRIERFEYTHNPCCQRRNAGNRREWG